MSCLQPELFDIRYRNKTNCRDNDRPIVLLCVSLELVKHTKSLCTFNWQGNKCLSRLPISIILCTSEPRPFRLFFAISSGSVYTVTASFVRCLVKHWYTISKESEIFSCQCAGMVLHCICLNQTCNYRPCLFCLALMIMVILFYS